MTQYLSDVELTSAATTSAAVHATSASIAAVTDLLVNCTVCSCLSHASLNHPCVYSHSPVRPLFPVPLVFVLCISHTSLTPTLTQA